MCKLDHAIRGARAVQNALRCFPSDNELFRAEARASWQGFGSRGHKRTAFRYTQLVRARRWFPRKCSKSLVSRCLIVERLKVQSTQPIAAVAKRGRNCTRLAARFGHKLSRELLEQLLHVRQRLCCRETSRLLWRAVCSGSGDRRKLVHEDGLRRGVRIHKKERTQTRWTPRAAPLLRWLGSG